VNTEMPVKDAGVRGWVFYDAECRFCVAGMKRWGGLFTRRGFQWLPLQTPGTATRLGVSEVQLLEEMWLQLADGRVTSGVNAWATLMRSVWWLWPLGVLIAAPGINAIARAVYRWIARNRYCFGGSCKIHSHKPAGVRVGDVLVLGAIIVALMYLGRAWPAWIYMWGIFLALGLFAKWLTWRDARSVGCGTPVGRTLGWFLLWPGMDGRAFFAPARSTDRRVRETNGNEGGTLSADSAVRAPMGEWFAATTKLVLGIGLIWFVGPRFFAEQPLAHGWCAMIGIVLVLHFGLFHLLSLAWRSCGVNAAPIMNRPLAATSLAQLWGECWNTAFSIPSRRLVFQPFAYRFGTSTASFAVFAASGVLHDLVISIPARGGYGLPTAYFLLQGAGVWFERSRAGRALGLGRGVRGWLFTFVLAVGPLFWLFHPPAIRNVILPMLEAIGAK
jgi:predicted DCC family thiol-disulfide oxidoreductase YuxK